MSCISLSYNILRSSEISRVLSSEDVSVYNLCLLGPTTLVQFSCETLVVALYDSLTIVWSADNVVNTMRVRILQWNSKDFSMPIVGIDA